MATTTLGLLINWLLAEVLSHNPWQLPYVGEQPAIRGNDLSRLLAASAGFAPQFGADRVMPGEPVPYPPFAFLVLGLLATLPKLAAWSLFYLPAFLQIGVAATFARTVGRPGTRLAWFFAILLVYPFLYVLDRGNIDLYTGLLCFGALLWVDRGRTMPAAVALGTAAALKIYPTALLLILVRRDWRAFLFGLLVLAGETVASLAVFGLSPRAELAYLLHQFGRTSACFQLVTPCLNLSAAVPFNVVWASIVSIDWFSALSSTTAKLYTVLSLGCGAMVSALVIVRPGRLWLDALRLTLVMTLVPVMSYDYKLLLYMGPLLLMLKDLRAGRPDVRRDAAIILTAILLSSWKWLGQYQHLWIHSVAQLVLAWLALSASHRTEAPEPAGSGPFFLLLPSFRTSSALGGMLAALLVWHFVGTRIIRHGWAATTNWCAGRLTFSPADPLPVWGRGWAGFDGEDGGHWRWTVGQTAALYLPLKGPTTLRGTLALPPGAPAETLEMRVDGTVVQSVPVAAGGTAPFVLPLSGQPPGLHRIDLVAPRLQDVGGRWLGLSLSAFKVETSCS